MKIFIVSQHFYPDSFRINDIAVALAKRGHEVTVLTSLPDYATGTVPADCKGLKNRQFMYHGVRVVRCFSVSRRSGVLFRMLNYVSFCVSSTLRALCMKEKFDLSFSYQTSPVLMANAARAIANRQGIPFFLYCLDLWPESLKAWHVGEESPLFRLMHRYSKKMYARADLLAVSSRPFLDYMTEVNGILPEKMVYLPQHSEDMKLAARPARGADRPVIFAFGGNIGSVQNVECILRAVARLCDLDGFSVSIYGDGSELEHCRALADTLKLGDRVRFFGRVDRETLWNAYHAVDAFLLTLKSEGMIGQTVPAKLQEYMSGGRPIFAAIDGAAADVIREADCGVAVPSDDDRALAEAMRRFILEPNTLEHAGENGRRYFEAHFTEKIFLDELENHFAQLTVHKAGGKDESSAN